MMPSRATVFCLVALAALPGLLSAQVMETKIRERRLAEIDSVVTLRPEELATAMKDVEDPFFPARAVLSGKAPSTSTNASLAGEMAADDVLAGVADLLRPTGLMMGASRRFIVSSLGDLYEVGKTVRVTLPDGVHDILVESADSEGYVLRFAGARLSRKFVDDSGSTSGKPVGK